MTVWLHVIGVGADGADGLGPAARTLVGAADLVVGGARHLDLVPGGNPAQQRLAWPSPFMDGIRMLQRWRAGHPATARAVVLASGDPLWFGVGATLLQHFDPAEISIQPAPSAFSLAAARMGWPLQQTACISLHGRPVAALALHLAPGQRLLCLTSGPETPAEVAALLQRDGYGPSPLTVLGNLGGPDECMLHGSGDRPAQDVPALHVLAIDCRVAQDRMASAAARSRLAGLPDDAFEHDGKMTKREVRAITLSRLAPAPGQHLWDIGAGCGSVAIEWLRAGQAMRATGLEPDADRRAMAARNAIALGVPHLDLRATSAPAGLADLDDPDAIFVGGGVAGPGLLQLLWSRLSAGGRLVANAVTVQGQAALMAAHGELGGDLVRLSVERVGPIGRGGAAARTTGLTGWRPAMAVMQWSAIKGAGDGGTEE